MHKIDAPSQLLERVYDAILDAICTGMLKPGERVTQEGLAAQLGVSRQPILQAIHLLKRQGFIEDSGRKGVEISAIDPARLVQLYQIRAALDGLAASEAARLVQRDGPGDLRTAGDACLALGHEAIAGGSASELIAADMAFHQFIYQRSGNPMIADTTAIHWQHIRRAMGAHLQSEPGMPEQSWREHAEILDAVIDGQPELAEQRARSHAERAAEVLVDRLADVMTAPR
jgi:DNA-binding GntR family transcriptional regulator